MTRAVISTLLLVGCSTRVEHAQSLIDDGDYVAARAILSGEACQASQVEVFRCALAHALVADGLGDKRSRDIWLVKASQVAPHTPTTSSDYARFDALMRRASWDRQVEATSLAAGAP